MVLDTAAAVTVASTAADTLTDTCSPVAPPAPPDSTAASTRAPGRKKKRGKEPEVIVEGDLLENTPKMVALVWSSLALNAAYLAQVSRFNGESPLQLAAGNVSGLLCCRTAVMCAREHFDYNASNLKRELPVLAGKAPARTHVLMVETKIEQGCYPLVPQI